MTKEHSCGCTSAEEVKEVVSAGCGCGGNCACGAPKETQGMEDFSEGRTDLGLTTA